MKVLAYVALGLLAVVSGLKAGSSAWLVFGLGVPQFAGAMIMWLAFCALAIVATWGLMRDA